MSGPDGLAPPGRGGTGTLPYAVEETRMGNPYGHLHGHRTDTRADARTDTRMDTRMKGSPTCDCDFPGPYPQDRTGERDVRTGRDGDGADGVR